MLCARCHRWDRAWCLSSSSAPWLKVQGTSPLRAPLLLSGALPSLAVAARTSAPPSISRARSGSQTRVCLRRLQRAPRTPRWTTRCERVVVPRQRHHPGRTTRHAGTAVLLQPAACRLISLHAVTRRTACGATMMHTRATTSPRARCACARQQSCGQGELLRECAPPSCRYHLHAHVQALQQRRQGAALPLKLFHNDIKRRLLAKCACGSATLVCTTRTGLWAHTAPGLPSARRFARRGCSLLDLCCGRGGDLQKWRDCGVRYVYGVDISRNEVDEAMRRYQEMLQDAQRRKRREAAGVSLQAPCSQPCSLACSSSLLVSPWCVPPPRLMQHACSRGPGGAVRVLHRAGRGGV